MNIRKTMWDNSVRLTSLSKDDRRYLILALLYLTRFGYNKSSINHCLNYDYHFLCDKVKANKPYKIKDDYINIIESLDISGDCGALYYTSMLNIFLTDLMYMDNIFISKSTISIIGFAVCKFNHYLHNIYYCYLSHDIDLKEIRAYKVDELMHKLALIYQMFMLGYSINE